MTAILEAGPHLAVTGRAVPGLAGPADHDAVARTAPAPGAGQPGEFLTFRLGEEAYGVDILCVQEIRRYETPTRLSGAHPWVRGVVDLRGTIVPLVDLRLCLATGEPTFGPSTVVIVLNLQGRTVGAIVDAVSDVVAPPPADLRPPPALGRLVPADHIVGIACLRSPEGEHTVILADLGVLLGRALAGAVTA